MRLAYADPPYMGQAKLYKADHRAAEVNHPLLIAYLDTFDAWALSASSPSLRAILPMCPEDVRVMAWIKPFASFKPGVNPAYAWEPVIVRGGRKHARYDDTVRDWLSASITLQKGLTGAKPPTFAQWLFDVWNAQPGDEFTDVFPGTGIMRQAWDTRFTERPEQMELSA